MGLRGWGESIRSKVWAHGGKIVVPLDYLLPTTVVGSYPQPAWLIDRAKLGSKVPRVRAPEIWRVDNALLEEAQDDATLLAIRDMERAGIDIITDGEMRRESYSNRFATELEGIDIENPGSTINRSGVAIPVPRVAAPIRRKGPVEVRDVTFLRANTSRKTKITLPGPFTMAQQAQDDYYRDEEALALAFAAAVNEELRDLKAAGEDVVQIDEPWLQARPERAARYGVKAINRALEGIPGTTVVHLCFGYAAAVKDKPTGYSFLPQLEATSARQISIEAAQPRLDLGVLRAGFQREVEALLAPFDAFLLPTLPCIAPPIAEVDASDEAYFRWNMRILRIVGLVNFLDGCAVSLPCHERAQSPIRAPVGFMVCGPALSDRRILAVAAAIERTLASD